MYATMIKTVRFKRILAVFVVSLLAISFCIASFVRSDVCAANIVKGDSIANVKAVQIRLSNLGYYSGKIDGIWGSKTNTAIRGFQRDKGLTVDGIIGTKTEKALGITLTSVSSNGTSATTSDINLLARCVFGEARGEPYEGQVAVAAVVLNRVKSSSFPNTISGVIYQKWAFTAVADGQINLAPNQSAYNAARDALNGYDPTKGCLYYYNPATATSKWIWSLKVERTIGRHSFAKG